MLGTSSDTGTRQSRRRQKYADETGEETLARLRKESPDVSAAELREIARHYVIDHPSSNFTMWLVEALAQVIRDKPSQEKAAERAARGKQLIATMAEAHEEIVEIQASIRLLEWVTPYGRPLSECTGAECKRLSRRFGSFFDELSKRLTPGETVGAHFPEAALQAIARTHRLIGERATR
jgi:hypothetical protein